VNFTLTRRSVDDGPEVGGGGQQGTPKRWYVTATERGVTTHTTAT